LAQGNSSVEVAILDPACTCALSSCIMGPHESVALAACSTLMFGCALVQGGANGSDARPAICESNPGCRGLGGDCCPAPDGNMLNCCFEPGRTAACSDWLGCVGLPGECCSDAPGGPWLACCGEEAPTEQPPHDIVPPIEQPPHDIVPPTEVPPPKSPYTNNYEGGNPLGIQVVGSRSSNYFIILGDWGKAGSPGVCQRAVADMMKNYIRGQKASGKNLLFVASVGDNFYWSGITPGAWETSWAEPYGTNHPDSPLFNVPWLSVLGNHDYGNSDAYAFCPSAQGVPLASVAGQSYGHGQFNADKNPERPANTRHYWMPDYNYHYEIPEASLEVIALDTNYLDIDNLGGDARGNAAAFNMCGGIDSVRSFMSDVAMAGQDLLRERARLGTAKTVLIIQHYPGACQRDVFEAALPAGREVNILCSYGHVHSQACEGRDVQGNCDTILSGGGGGCCFPEVSQAGFAAVHLTDDGGFESVVDTPEVIRPPGTCRFTRRLNDV